MIEPPPENDDGIPVEDWIPWPVSDSAVYLDRPVPRYMRDEPSDAPGPLRMQIGADGDDVIAKLDEGGWRVIVRGETYATEDATDDLAAALRDLALRDRSLARGAFGVLCNWPGTWEDDYTEFHGADALPVEDWIDYLESGCVIVVDDDTGELIMSLRP